MRRIYVSAWTIFVGLLLSMNVFGADQQGLHIILAGNAPSPMKLVPGLYVSAGERAQAAQYRPKIEALRVDKVDGTQVTGTLELIRLGVNGEVDDFKSRVTGTLADGGIFHTAQSIIVQGNHVDFNIVDGPLGSMIRTVSGGMQPNGIILNWDVVQTDSNLDSSSNLLVPTSEDRYQQLVAQYQVLAQERAALLDQQSVSARLIQDRYNQFTQESALWLKEFASDPLNDIVSKAQQMYAEERRLLTNVETAKIDPAVRQATVDVMQINTYWWEVHLANQRLKRAQKSHEVEWEALEQLIEQSPCVTSTSGGDELEYDASPACATIPSILKAYSNQRRELIRATSKADQDSNRQGDVFFCIFMNANHLLNPKISIYHEMPGC
ncbi:hypothetical protein [Dyella sp. C9]|uniref:hypothetical protein n=1 Tax=Dyella sp. C9 TaxID=2202154 RepID=UPI0013005F1B|nr:hypothetical protein [Dyella sp. C9]